ncbi:MAG: methyltransferase family protein [Thermoplasmata archaeon]
MTMEVVTVLLLVVVALGILLWLAVFPYWEREFMTGARRRELEARRSEKCPTRLANRVWALASGTIFIGLPVLLIADGLVLNIGLLYSPYLSFFNPFDGYLQVVGLIVSFVGLAIMAVAGRTLAEHVYAKATGERDIIRTGIYAYIRHPLYLTFILVPVGILLLTLNYLALLILAAFSVFTDSDLRECGREGKFTFIATAIRCEEKGLLKKYGSDYEEYMRTTGRLFPRIRR